VTCLPPTSPAGMSLLPPRSRRRLDEGRTLILPQPFLVYMRNPGPIGTGNDSAEWQHCPRLASPEPQLTALVRERSTISTADFSDC
jgi:hypothetical protein